MDLKNKLILVTGGTGFIGRGVIRALLDAGARVRCFDNDSRGSSARLGDMLPKIEMIHGDIRDAVATRNAIKGVDSVVHLAYVNGTEYFYTKPELILDVAVKGMINVLDGCMAEGVKDLSLASSSEVYQTPPSVPTDESAPLSVPDVLNPRYSYGGGKIICELMAINYGRKNFDRVTIFRPHNVYGPAMGYEHVIPQFADRMRTLPAGEDVPFPIQGTGKETRSFIFIDDFAQGLLRILENGQHLNIYHIGTEDEVTIEQLAKSVAKVMGRSIRIQPGKLQPGGTLRRCPNIAKLRSLGFAPKISLEEGLRRTLPWYAENPKPTKT
jgi:nucleoside-diphosphate-sugar epimerase